MSNKVWDAFLILLALLAAIWFFTGYAYEEPRSSASLTLTGDNAELKAAEILSDLGYSISNYETTHSFRSNRQLLDSLQHNLGRSRAIGVLGEGPVSNIKPYYWNVFFENPATPASGRIGSNQQEGGRQAANSLAVKLDEQGAFIAFNNASDLLPQQLTNRKALSSVFRPEEDSASSEVFTTVPDSLLGRLLYFDLQRNEEPLVDSGFADRISRRLQSGRPYQYTRGDAEKMAAFYLKNTGWDINAFTVDTVTIKRVNSINSANVTFMSNASQFQQDIRLDLQVTPTGSLLQLDYAYNSIDGNGDGTFPLWPIIRMAVIFLICLGAIVGFFFRIRSRAIDTQSALVVAIVMGLIIPVLILMNEIGNLEFSGAWVEQILLLIQMGLGGAVASVGFFVLFALSDSITRQHWPAKLSTYDYLRQGMLFNKPVGMAVLRSIGLAFVLTGVWMFTLQILPYLHLEVDYVFLSEQLTWPPLYLFLETLWISLMFILAVFLVIGSQVYAWRKNILSVCLSTVVASGVFIPIIISAGPALQLFFVGCLLGLALTIIFLKWDFLTLFLSLFLFMLLLGTSSGWLVAGSPDGFVFWIFLVFLFFLLVGSVLAVFMGKEERSLPKYVPDYVEELAQEERIKQELAIARGVQQSFLPVTMPKLTGLDIAALCRPAYETGGDYYDVIKLSESKVAVTIGDVSGKGIPAAFYMTFTKGIIHSLCRETDSPAELLIKANRLFFQNAKRGTFISLVYGIIDLEKQTFTFARAGHNPIIKINNTSGEVQELRPIGLGLGMTDRSPFEQNIKEVELPLREDETLILYTDGIVEAQNNISDFYGTDKLVSSLKKHLKRPSAEILNYAVEDVTTFIGAARQYDDMTMMVIRMDDTINKIQEE